MGRRPIPAVPRYYHFGVTGAQSWIAVVQGAYYVLTGIWPIVSIRTFMAVTGPKRDIWLVRTVGVLIIVIGAVLCLAAARNATTFEIRILAVASAFALAGVDVIYVARGTIPKIYLLDAIAEAILIAAWGWAWSA